MLMNAYEKYYAAARDQLEKVFTTQRAAIEQAAAWLGEALASDHWLYAFGTGHSHMLAEEIFYRAGGLAHGVPMLDSKLMLHENAIEATYLEREEGYAAELLKQYPIAAGDVLIVASNSGRNAVPIELALDCRKIGMKVVVITAYADRSFTFVTKTPPSAYFLKKAAGVEKGSQTTGKGGPVGQVTMAQIREIAEKSVPPGAVQGTNDYPGRGYDGPQPPSGTHRYYFRIIALDKKLDLPSGAKRKELDKAMSGHVIAQGEYMGRYSHK